MLIVLIGAHIAAPLAAPLAENNNRCVAVTVLVV